MAHTLLDTLLNKWSDDDQEMKIWRPVHFCVAATHGPWIDATLPEPLLSTRSDDDQEMKIWRPIHFWVAGDHVRVVQK